MASNKVLFRSGGPAKPVVPAEISDPESVVLTFSAAQEVKRQAAKRGTPEAAIRVGLRGGGCSGYSYHFDWADGAPRNTDRVIEAHGARVYIDPKSLALLKGTVLDFVSSMMGHGFKFHNPNAKASCGCGESVSFG